MNNNAFCPISFKKTDENVARLNGLFTVLFLIAFVLTDSFIPVLFLLIDFQLRGMEKPQYSPFVIFSKFLLKTFKAKPQPINAGPKIFAARIGVLFSVMILITTLLQLPVLATVFAAIFGICAFLETAFSFCVACKIYPFWYKLIYQTNFRKVKSDFQI